MASYSHLAPELHRLSDDSALLWGDATARQAALDELVGSWKRGESDRVAATVERIDRAVVEGLSLLQLLRGDVEAVGIAEGVLTWLARWGG